MRKPKVQGYEIILSYENWESFKVCKFCYGVDIEDDPNTVEIVEIVGYDPINCEICHNEPWGGR